MAIAIALLVAAAPASLAQDNGLNSAEYKELVRKALQEYSLGNWTEARVFFSKAHEIAPNARTLRGLALVCYESRRYVESLAFADQALLNPIQPLTAQMQKELRQYAEQARSFVARTRIVSDPADAALRIDGQLAVRAEDGAILLDAGDHELVASAAGYEPYTRALNVQGGTEARFDIALTPQPSALAHAPSEIVPTPSAPAAPLAPPASGLIAPWIVVGASAAVAVAGGVLLGIASADKSKVENVKPGTSWNEIKDAYQRAPTFFAAGWVMLGVGVAGVATGLTWKFWLEPQAEQRASAELKLSPNGIELSGAF